MTKLCDSYEPYTEDAQAQNTTKNESELEDFFIYKFADFGYLTFIAQNSAKNITLYAGIVHCSQLVQDLEKIGYKTIFTIGSYDEKSLFNNIIPGHCSKEEYQAFFAI